MIFYVWQWNLLPVRQDNHHIPGSVLPMPQSAKWNLQVQLGRDTLFDRGQNILSEMNNLFSFYLISLLISAGRRI
jgi:hypothetical protein